MTYKIFVDDNFHYMDESERYEFGEYETLTAALQAAKGIVDACLTSAYKPGITADDLYKGYISFGEDPFIIPTNHEETITFSAWDYAKQRCAELCNQ